ncbi:hypothetical protein C7450_107434 [Chelatococcus asaccharovorans]|uniref:Uncharacterized protein n=1 Tax=Chelatococcus asaccharovorans TaxID=28210 RepID=A0A2V3U3Z7_9HYPH|nr:hypothetical protein C7450_107434 [Chelatococcus asaccharovorans]
MSGGTQMSNSLHWQADEERFFEPGMTPPKPGFTTILLLLPALPSD